MHDMNDTTICIGIKSSRGRATTGGGHVMT